jgi:transcriptional regulator with XRE-family HTH domain
MAKTIRSTGHAALCEALTHARKAAGLTQAALSERLHYHQSLIARIESGARRIDVIELVVLLIAALPEYFLHFIELLAPEWTRQRIFRAVKGLQQKVSDVSA